MELLVKYMYVKYAYPSVQLWRSIEGSFPVFLIYIDKLKEINSQWRTQVS